MQLADYLKELKINICTIVDENNFNLLHHAVLKGGNPGKIEFLIGVAKEAVCND